jgi:hypothetical protein
MNTELCVIVDYLNNMLKKMWMEDSFEWTYSTNTEKSGRIPRRVWANIIGETYTIREKFQYLQKFTQERIDLLVFYWMIALGSFAKESLDKEMIINFSKTFLESSLEDFNVMYEVNMSSDVSSDD